ncbi:MAG: PIG-L family deacetylase [Acidobacteria bacterium]|nr:PIG-L family deacetylase [Acidobacteriota bacterium]
MTERPKSGWEQGSFALRVLNPFAFIAILLALSFAFSRTLFTAPIAPPETTQRTDATAIAEAIERLPVVGSVLLTGAHPDDENNALLAYLARGLHLRTAYLSETRGDGGQNLIGNEQYEALGMLRTEELLAARRLDGADQYFGQAYDFGFSKSADETLEKWGREQALGDFVRVIRSFRPDIVISRFTGTSADGHGHHQASGILTKEAFRAAADSARFPEQVTQGLRPWQATKLFVNLFRASGNAPGILTISEGVFSSIYGRTYPEIGQEARSRHRSQGMGAGGGQRGPVLASFRLSDSVIPDQEPDRDLFAGMDFTLNRFTTLAGGSPAVTQRVEAIQKAIETARETLSPLQPEKVLPALAEGLDQLRELRAAIEQSTVEQSSKEQGIFLLEIKEADFVRAISLSGGVSVEAVVNRGELVPGETFQVTVNGLLRTREYLQAGEITLTAPQGWKVEKIASGAVSAKDPGEMETKFNITVPADALPSQPYWLVSPRTNDYFPTPAVPWIGAPWNPALLMADFKFSLKAGGKSIPVEQQTDVIYRYADRVYGEREQPLVIVPPLGVWMNPEVAIFPTGSASKQTLLVRVRNNTAGEQRGTARLDLPPGWSSNPPAQPVVLAKHGDEVSARFEVSAPSGASVSKPERNAIKAVVQIGDQLFSTGYQVIDYPHIQARYWFRPAEADFVRLDVKVAPGLRVGYVMGTGDEVPEALKQLGILVEPIGPEELAFGNLGRFDAIVTGIRAYEVRNDLVSNHARLMEYVKNGGVMIVQYSRPLGYSPPLGPYPMNLGSQPRVTVEEAPVNILEPSNPIFQSPNRITEKDFEGWVQERGVYFMESWSPEYHPLLESHDPGEPPQKGGMLFTPYGKGFYIFTGYIWSRQLPAGVPGAYRIFANLVSLGNTKRQ